MLRCRNHHYSNLDSFLDSGRLHPYCFSKRTELANLLRRCILYHCFTLHNYQCFNGHKRQQNLAESIVEPWTAQKRAHHVGSVLYLCDLWYALLDIGFFRCDQKNKRELTFIPSDYLDYGYDKGPFCLFVSIDYSLLVQKLCRG